MTTKKTILIAIDFYKNSIDAFKYGIAYAMENKVDEVILLHSVEYEDNKKNALQKMEDLTSSYKELISFQFTISDYNLSLTVNNIEKEQRLAFIFMGITGKNKIGQNLIGSEVFNLMQCASTPIWIIPENTVYQKIEQAALALPFIPELIEVTPYEEIKALIKEHQAKLTIINVGNRRDEKEQVYQGLREMFAMFDDIEPAYHFPSGNQVADLILDYINKNSFQVLINLVGTYGVLERLFSPSVTKKIAYNSPIPLIIYPRKEK